MTGKKTINTAAYLHTGIVPLQHLIQHIIILLSTDVQFYKDNCPTIELAEDSSVKMLRVADLEVKEVLVPIQEDDTLEEPMTLDVIAELTEVELEEEFNKLSDKIRYNQWIEFHEHYQKTHGIAGTSSQIIHYISDLNKPAIPVEIAKEELANVDVDDEQVQIVKMVDKDGKLVKKVKPILIKKELNKEHATVIPFEKHPGEVSFTDDERVPFHTTSPVEYVEEVTDDRDYKDDDEVISIKSNSSTAESTLDDDFEAVNPLMFDASLVKITTGLKQSAEGFKELQMLLPNIPITEIPNLVEEVPLPYLTLMLKALVQALRSVGEERLIDLALREEYDKGASQVSLMIKYGVTRNWLHKIITGASRPGGSQYQQTIKKEKPANQQKRGLQVKTETSAPLLVPKTEK